MNNDVKISASIMCIDWLSAGNQLKALEDEKIDYLHWDIVDGSFAPDFTMGSSIINKFKEVSKIKSDYHLMVEEPSRLFNAFKIEQGDIFTIHQECCRNLHRDIISIRRLGAKVGVAICPGTPIDTLEYVIEDIDQVTLMTVNPGYAGQKLVPQVLRKINDLKQMILDMKLDVKIELDGNVSPQYIPQMVAEGADVLVGGSSGLFRKDISLQESIQRMRDDIYLGLSLRRH